MYYDFLPCSRQTYNPIGPDKNMVPSQSVYQTPQTGYTQPGFTQPTYPSAPIGTTLPTGVPLGPNITGPDISSLNADVMPTTLESYEFTPGFLRTQIGKRVRVEFLIGTGTLVDRSGTLVGVGASYILIRPVESDDVMLCDIYSIKFVTIFY